MIDYSPRRRYHPTRSRHGARRSPLLINTPVTVHVVRPHKYMVTFSMAVIVDGEEWLGLVGGGGGYL